MTEPDKTAKTSAAAEPAAPTFTGPTRAGFVAIIGATNAGKSTLVNRLVGTKVSIVSRKVQTTRGRIRGIAMHGGCQLVLVDTPGIFRPRRRLDRAMVDAAWSEASQADITVFLIDAARGLSDDVDRVTERLANWPSKPILVLNKIDLTPKEELLALSKTLNDRCTFEATFMISAERGFGVDDLGMHLVAAMPEGPWLYPQDQVADAPIRSMAAEITREKIYDRLHEELPYASTVETTQWKPLKDGSIRVEQTIFVERESQRAIVLGDKGRAIKSISMDARKDIAEMAEKPVHLFLFVKVRENWGDDPERYREMGLDFPKE
jgi:GTPase